MANAVKKLDLTDSRETAPAKPFIKWAGGKSQLLPELRASMPTKFEQYFEPFLGGGALFFSLASDGLTGGNVELADISSELVNCYQIVRDRLPELLDDLVRHRNDADYFYSLRNIDRLPEFANWSEVARASRFIYLNKTCFNGLYRVNSKGHFNVPFGRYESRKVFDAESMERCSAALKQATLRVGSFHQVLDRAAAGDFVYFDPPYDPLSSSSSFTAYSRDGFNRTMQYELRDVCVELDSRGVSFMLSNSYTTFVLGLYNKFNVRLVHASRAINSDSAGRGKIKEVLVTNY